MANPKTASKAKSAKTKTKTTTKATKAPTNKPTAKTATKTSTAKSTPKATAKPTAKPTKKHLLPIVIGIILGVILLGVAIFFITKAIIDGSTATGVITNGRGQELESTYIGVAKYKYKILIPDSFTKLSHDEIVETYGSEDGPTVVYANNDKSVNIALSEPSTETKNDQIAEYLRVMESVYGLSADIIETELREVEGYNVGIIRMVTAFTDDDIYNVLAFFAYDDKLTVIAFNCPDKDRNVWEKVGEEVINSLTFNK